MARPRRSDRCPCGSGIKARRCCHDQPGATPQERAHSELITLARAAAPDLQRCSVVEFERLLDTVAGLPRAAPSLAWPLPVTGPTELVDLRRAVGDGDLEAVKAALPPAVAAVDCLEGRVALARAVVALRDTQRLAPESAAAAVVDLASGSPQLVTASVVEAVAAELSVSRADTDLVFAAS
jgi:hypothetical protein